MSWVIIISGQRHCPQDIIQQISRWLPGTIQETNQRVLDHIPANRWGDTQDLMGAAIFFSQSGIQLC